VTDTCPSWPILLAWLENDLPAEEGQLLSTHVADCEECRERLAMMDVVTDAGDMANGDMANSVSAGRIAAPCQLGLGSVG